MTNIAPWVSSSIAGLGFISASVATGVSVKSYREERRRRTEEKTAAHQFARESQARRIAVWLVPNERALCVRNDSDLPIYRVQPRWMTSLDNNTVADGYPREQPAPIEVLPPHESVVVPVPGTWRVWREAEVYFIDAAGNAWHSQRGRLTPEPWSPAGENESDVNNDCGHLLRRRCMKCGWCVECKGRCACGAS